LLEARVDGITCDDGTAPFSTSSRFAWTQTEGVLVLTPTGANRTVAASSSVTQLVPSFALAPGQRYTFVFSVFFTTVTRTVSYAFSNGTAVPANSSLVASNSSVLIPTVSFSNTTAQVRCVGPARRA
jgi:hypothetical protein